MRAPWPHQQEDTQALLEHPAYALFLTPGLGKSRIVIDAACQLYSAGEIDVVVVVGPASARSVWSDPDPVLGEVAKWMPEGFLFTVQEYHAKNALPKVTHGLSFIVTNPEFIRRLPRLDPLIAWCQERRVLLVGDESWQWQSPQAQQTKAMAKLRAACDRVVLLNGTPGEMKHLYSQFAILDKAILGCKNWFVFRNRYCVMGGWMGKDVTGYQRVEEFDAKTKPFAVYREIRDHLDLGDEPRRTQIDVRLTPATWRIYREMEDDLVSWLSDTEVATASQAAVRTMRLAQVTNGFVGGVEETVEGQFALQDLATYGEPGREKTTAAPTALREVGREKLDALLAWLPANWDGTKLLIFTRFRADVERTAAALQATYPTHAVAKLYGGQKPAEREAAKRLLAPDGDPRPAIVVANTQSGGAGLNFAAASLCVFLANDFSLKTRIQAEGRVDRPGQTRQVTYVDVLAYSPDGLTKTVDSAIVSALRRKADVSSWTVDMWRQALKS